MLLMENINVFQMNGFDFHFQEDGKFYLFPFWNMFIFITYQINYLLFLAEPTKKVKLTMIPISNNWSFGKEDIDELLFMLQVNCNFNIMKFKITILFLFLINT